MRTFEILSYAGSVLAVVLGSAGMLRRTKSMVQWIFLAGMVLLAVEDVLNAMSFRALLPDEILRWQRVRFMVLSVLPGLWLLFSLSYSRGNFRQFLKGWGFVLAAVFVIPVFLVTVHGDATLVRIHEGPHPYEWHLELGWAGKGMYLVHLLVCIVILMNLERTFGASVGTMRWRIKYMVLGVGLLFAVRVYTSSQVLLFSSINLTMLGVNGIAVLLGGLLMIRSLLREGLFNQDVYPSGSVLSFSLTGLLAGLYLLIVGVLARLIAMMGGDLTFPLKAFLVMVSLVILATLLLSEKLKQGMRRFVSRHFQRPSYDYRLIWTTFTQQMASIPDRDDYCREIVKWVSRTLNVLSVTIWLKEDATDRLTFGASTSLEEKNARSFSSMEEGMEAWVEAVIKRPEPAVVDDMEQGWAGLLRRHNPNWFKECTDRVFVPVVIGNQLLGLMALGDRVNNAPYSLEDLDLLKCLRDQIAANLVNIRLSAQLVESKELEAFQAMSAFFVHDLKNTASTLSLMLRNMPAHFDDPEFRADALRGLSKCVMRINDLIARLGMLRQDLGLTKSPMDPNQVFEAAIEGLGPLKDIRLTRSLQPMARIPMDGEQIRKVLTNLLVNATEAVEPGGEVRVASAASGPHVKLIVADNGCGMDRSYMAKRLFRPFQTTKKKGIGIGLFLSRRIVEAHGGLLKVESELGKGTTFTLLLPRQETEL